MIWNTFYTFVGAVALNASAPLVTVAKAVQMGAPENYKPAGKSIFFRFRK